MQLNKADGLGLLFIIGQMPIEQPRTTRPILKVGNTDMTTSHHRQLALQQNPDILRGILRGIEKEGLRVDAQGRLARTPHPQAVGSALTNERITTDYAESLLELITRPHTRVEDLLQELRDIHTFVAGKLDQEMIWNQSMPATLPDEKDIAIAWYGTSNTGMLKHVYRRGLAERYGKTMQCIAGVHYNFSLPDAIWPLLGAPGESLQDQRSNGYLALIRNFTRHSWLLMYLFGASPALASSFLHGRPSTLDHVDADTLTMPWATSLRMSDLGYHNKEAQAELQLCYNDLDTFVMRMYHAAVTPWPDYEKIGTHRNGEWIQLNTHILQIENEYYSSIRPKRTTARCERPATALAQRGVEYIEVRCMDIDPESPVGISEQTCRFLDTFLLYCAAEDSPYFPDGGYCQDSKNNFATVVREGRRPGLTLINQQKQVVTLQDWGRDVLQELLPYARLLDQALDTQAHTQAVQAQLGKLVDPEQTPSAQLLARLRESGLSFHDYSLQRSREHHAALLSEPLQPAAQAAYEEQAAESLLEQARIEARDEVPFEEYVRLYERNLVPPELQPD